MLTLTTVVQEYLCDVNIILIYQDIKEGVCEVSHNHSLLRRRNDTLRDKCVCEELPWMMHVCNVYPGVNGKELKVGIVPNNFERT